MKSKRAFFVIFFSWVFFFGNSAEAAEKSVRIKVAEYPGRFDFDCPQGGTWALGGKTGKLGKKDRSRVTGNLRRRAVKRFHVMVESVPMRDPDKLAASLAKWKGGPRPIHVMTIGRQSFAPDRKTVLWDGRVVMIGVGVFGERPAAQKLVDELASENLSSWIHEEVVRCAEGDLVLAVNGRRVAAGKELVLHPSGLARLKKVEHAKGYSWHGFADRSFRGILSCRWGAQDAIDCVLETGLETILAGVVPSEISSRAARGALQAQAIAARGEILSKVGLRHLNEGFEFCSQQHCQVFSGESAESAAMAKEIAPTVGMVMTDSEGGIVDAVYAANCGGHGEANHLVWTSPPDPILEGVWDCALPPALDLSKEADAAAFIRKPPACYCQDPTVEGGDKFRWTRTLSAAEWQTVEKDGGVGRIRDVSNFARGNSGRIYRITLSGESGTRTVMKELNIRKLFGGLRSACFVATWTRDSQGFIVGATFSGAGWGHGVGMCQTGAQSLAKQNWGFERILAHYFPNSRLVKFY